jgi:predicted transcriptional regulator
MRKLATKREAKNGTAKRKVLAAVRSLPAEATIEDAIERLVFLAKIDRGLAEVGNGKAIDHAEVKRRLLR